MKRRDIARDVHRHQFMVGLVDGTARAFRIRPYDHLDRLAKSGFGGCKQELQLIPRHKIVDRAARLHV
jgi:hypothetical protein